MNFTCFSRSCVLVLSCLLWVNPVSGTEFAVPHNGSPYQNLSELKEGQILHLPTGVKVSSDQLLDFVGKSRVIYIGETHDNLEAHRIQLEILRGLSSRSPGKVAVGMEMFRQSAQPQLDLWREGKLPKKDFKRLFRKHWGPAYSLYLPITDFARAQGIPLIGLKSSEETEQLLRDGGPEAPGLPEIDFNDPYHRAYSMSLFGANKDHAPEVLKPYQMLLLWEESMAETVSHFLNNPAYKDWKLIVLAGGFHVQYGYGIPKRAFRRTPHAYSIVLPTITKTPEKLKDREMNLDPVSIPLYSADFAWMVSYQVPEDNGIKLGVMLSEEDRGLFVKSVMDGSNGARLGVKPEDRIVSFDGQPIDNIDDLREHLQKKSHEDSVTIKIERGRETVSLVGTLRKNPADQ